MQNYNNHNRYDHHKKDHMIIIVIM